MPSHNFFASMVGAVSWDYSTLTATGSSQSDAAPVTSAIVDVLATGDNQGIILPACRRGLSFWIQPPETYTLQIYPASGEKFHYGSADAAIAVTDNTPVLVVGMDTGRWSAIYDAGVV